MQNVATIIKTSFVAFLALLPLVAVSSEPFDLGELWPARVDQGLVLGIGSALAAIMWAYDGWGNVTVVAEEVRNPQRNVPIALIVGVVILIVLYAGANLAYHLTLPSSVHRRRSLSGHRRMRATFGQLRRQADAGHVARVAVRALDVNILVGPRVLFAVAPTIASSATSVASTRGRGTPAVAIAGMCAWSCVLILTGGLSGEPDRPLFNVMTEWTVFGGSIFYFSAVVAVFILPPAAPDAERPYRTWGYPLVPAVFIGFYVVFLMSMMWERPVDRLIGIGLISLGVLAYLAFAEKTPRAPAVLAET